MKARLLASIALFLAAFFAPWWLVAVFCIIFVFFFKRCFEIIAVGIIVDLIYGSSPYLGGYHFTFTTIFIILFIFSEYFKKKLI